MRQHSLLAERQQSTMSEKSEKSPSSGRQRFVSISSDSELKFDASPDAKAADQETPQLPDPSMWRIFKLNAPEWPWIFIGCLGCIINGGVQPAFSIIFSDVVNVFTMEQSEQENRIRLYCFFFIGLGVLMFSSFMIMSYAFAKSGEALTMRIRKLGFQCLMRQDLAFYDDPQNSTGALTTRLATEASAVQGLTGSRLGTFLIAISNIGTAIVIGFILGPMLTLIILAFVPFIAMGGFFEMRLMHGSTLSNKKGQEASGKIAVEAIESHRTVQSLGLEERLFSLYAAEVEKPFKKFMRKAQLVAIAFGFSNCIIFFAYSAGYTYGAYQIEEGTTNFSDMMKVFGVIVFGAQAVGQATSFAPNYGKAKAAAANILNMFDRRPAIDNSSDSGVKLTSTSGEILFQNVRFRYPSRPDIEVLKGFSVSVNAGQRLALVGSSGCGKSTSVALLERFYDPTDGQVLLDGRPLSQLSLQWLRHQIGIVSQEPVLFGCSIRDNIAYGDNSRPVPFDEIVAAARSANIHDFIDSLPAKYNTLVGERGAQLSGGQKQRVAIARALVRNPRLLLLDEATSALDAESEQVVQEALDNAQKGRTVVVIAHRLSTIRSADVICVLHQGEIVETGTHDQLMLKGGAYYKLNKAQVQM